MIVTPRLVSVVFASLAMSACGDGGGDADTDASTGGGSTGAADGTVGPTTTAPSTLDATTTPETSAPADTGSSGDADGSESSDSSSTGEPVDPGPQVDVSDPQLYELEFTPDEADPAATLKLAVEQAQLDTNATPIGQLVVYLHGAGAPALCGGQEHGRVLAAMGFHVVQPCYVSDYGVGNCGDDIGGCRLEAFEGVDHHPFIDIGPPDSIEVRVVRMLEHLQALHPGGDWQYFVQDGLPRWDRIVVSGISHGASSSGVVGMNRAVERVVMLSGPLDTDQAWLTGVPVTSIDRFWGFTHTGDEQHDGHLQAFDDLGLPGAPAVVDGAPAPWGDSHRLVTSAPTGDGHGSTQAGGASPTDGDAWAFEPVWRVMYGVQ